MPTRAAKRPRRRDRSAARRAAFHAAQLDSAKTPAERLKAASAYLVSVVAHSRGSARLAREQRDDIAGHAAEVMDRAELSRPARRLHEAKLAEAGTDVHRLGRALMVLQSAIDRLPEAERDQMADHYAAEIRREATQVRR